MMGSEGFQEKAFLLMKAFRGVRVYMHLQEGFSYFHARE